MNNEHKKNKAIFFDRDGVINYRLVKEYVKNIDEFRFLPDFFEFFRTIKSRGFLAIIITNQQALGKGLIKEEELLNIHRYLQSEVKNKTGYEFDDIYYCPALASDNSPDRKPAPGMILKAMAKHDIDPQQAVIIGDRASDAKAGRNAGIKSILLGNAPADEKAEADFLFNNFDEASEFVTGKLFRQIED